MKYPVWMGIFLGLAITVAGCSKDSSSEKSSSGGTAASDPATSPSSTDLNAAHLLTSNVPKRKTFEGRWVLIFFDPATGSEVPAALVEITKSDKDSRWRAAVRQFGLALSNPSLKQAQASASSVHLLVELNVQPTGASQTATARKANVDMVVELHDGIARGDAQMSPLESILVQMVPTELESIQELRPQPLAEASELMVDKSDKEEVGIEKSLRFIKAHPDNPLTVAVYPIVFNSAGKRKMSEAALTADADQFVKLASRWGTRVALKSRVEIATALVKSNYHPQLAIKQIDQALSQLTEETIRVWKGDLETLKQAAESMRALDVVHSGTEAEKAKAVEELQAHIRVRPYNPIFLCEIATYDEQHGKKEDALSAYAKLAVLPMFDGLATEYWKHEKQQQPTPRQSAEKIWKELHSGKTDGFEKYLDGVYAQSMPKYVGKQVKPRPTDSNNRVVLCELFTGTSCPPCVAADVAFDHLLQTYAPPTEMIGLEYHENIPRPDPLANHDTESRFGFYYPDPKDRSTPTFAFAGYPVQRGGLLHQASDLYSAIRPAVDQLLVKSTSVKIQLKAEPKGNTVAVFAEADGQFSAYDPVRLRLALAEENVVLHGPNGIRQHEMVVRAMPGGAGGIEMKNGKLKYEGTVDLKTVKQQLDDDLTALEESSKTSFPAKPMDLVNLKLVAFVQNDATREVYQAAMIPFPTSAAHAAAPTTAAPVAAKEKTSSSPARPPVAKPTPAPVTQDAKKSAPKGSGKTSP